MIEKKHPVGLTMADYQVKIVLVRKANIIVFTLINIPTSGVKDREVISNDSGKTGEQTGSGGGGAGGGGEGQSHHHHHHYRHHHHRP